MNRRAFIASVVSATACPLVARARQEEPARRIGVLSNLAADDPEALRRVAVFKQGLQELGWNIGRNLQIDYRWGGGDGERYRQYSAELLTLRPEVLVTVGAPAVESLQRMTRTVPIVFVGVTDPVGGGLVPSLAHPGGNTTGFTLSEYGLSGKWLELLKEIAPSMTRVAVLRDPGSDNSQPFKRLRPPCVLRRARLMCATRVKSSAQSRCLHASLTAA